MKLFAEFGIQAINIMFEEGYFIPKSDTIQYRIEHNIPLDLPVRDHLQALQYKENLQQILQELSNS